MFFFNFNVTPQKLFDAQALFEVQYGTFLLKINYKIDQYGRELATLCIKGMAVVMVMGAGSLCVRGEMVESHD